MPQRIVREDLNSHPVIERLTPEEEVLFRRLINAVDDYGRYSGDLDLIVGECYPKRRRTLDDPELEEWLQGLHTKGAILLYESGGRRYLQMLIWEEKPRAKSSKYPKPPPMGGSEGPPPAPIDPGPGPGPGPQGGHEAPAESHDDTLPVVVPTTTGPAEVGQNAVSGQGDAEGEAEATQVTHVDEELTEAVRQLARCHEAHCVRTLNDTDAEILRKVVLDARDAGVPWQTLLKIMRDKQAEYLRERKTRTKPTIDRVVYYTGAWNAHIQAARDERAPLRLVAGGSQPAPTGTRPNLRILTTDQVE